jgi:hypothetical protein
MATRPTTYSDLTGKPIFDASQGAKIVVREHPLIEQPIQLDAAVSEVQGVMDKDKDYVLIDVVTDGTREQVVLDIAEFDRLFGEGVAVDDALLQAEPYKDAGRARKPAGDSIDYTAMENIGLVHRGKITEKEKQLVRDHLAVANENRCRQGQPEIKQGDPKYWSTTTEPAHAAPPRPMGPRPGPRPDAQLMTETSSQ